MKKIIVTLAVLCLLVASLAVMSSCGGRTETTTEATTTTEPIVTTQMVVTTTLPETTKSSVPEGYAVYNNNSISFVYPEHFVKQGDKTTVILQDEKTGNNVTVTAEKMTNEYFQMDRNDYKETLKPAFEAAGMRIGDYSVAQVKNEKGVAIAKIWHKITLNGQSMYQTMLVVNSNNKTYTVTITEIVPDSELVNNVFESLYRPS